MLQSTNAIQKKRKRKSPYVYLSLLMIDAWEGETQRNQKNSMVRWGKALLDQAQKQGVCHWIWEMRKIYLLDQTGFAEWRSKVGRKLLAQVEKARCFRVGFQFWTCKQIGCASFFLFFWPSMKVGSYHQFSEVVAELVGRNINMVVQLPTKNMRT